MPHRIFPFGQRIRPARIGQDGEQFVVRNPFVHQPLGARKVGVVVGRFGGFPVGGGFLEEFAQRLHVEVAVAVDPFLLRFDRKGANEAQAARFNFRAVSFVDGG